VIIGREGGGGGVGERGLSRPMKRKTSRRRGRHSVQERWVKASKGFTITLNLWMVHMGWGLKEGKEVLPGKRGGGKEGKIKSGKDGKKSGQYPWVGDIFTRNGYVKSS